MTLSGEKPTMEDVKKYFNDAFRREFKIDNGQWGSVEDYWTFPGTAAILLSLKPEVWTMVTAAHAAAAAEKDPNNPTDPQLEVMMFDFYWG